MNTILRLMLVAMLIIVATPAYSGEAIQMWKCELDDDASEQQIRDMAQDWLKAARGQEGGEQLEAYVYFPVAVNATGETDLMFIIVAPSFEEWGKFWDGYEGSAAAEIDTRNDEFVVCPDSVVWESFKVEAK